MRIIINAACLIPSKVIVNPQKDTIFVSPSVKNKFSRPKSSGAYMRVKIGSTNNPMTCATTFADSNFVKLRTPDD